MNKKHGFAAVIIPIVVLVVAAAGVGGYLLYKELSVNPLDRVYMAFSNLVTAKTIEQTAGVTVDVTSSQVSGNLDLTAKSASDISDFPNIKGTSDIHLKFALSGPAVASYAGGPLEVEVDFSVIALGKDIYFKLGLLNGDKLKGLMGPFSGYMGLITGKWIKANIDELENASSGGYNRYSGLYNNEEFKTFLEQYRDKIRDFLGATIVKYSLVKVDKDLGSEDVDGVSAAHYELVIDEENLFKSLSDIVKDGTDFARSILPPDQVRYIPEPEPLTENQIATFREAYDSVKDKLPKFEVWIKKSGNEFRKMGVSGKFDIPSYRSSFDYYGSDDSSVSGSVKYDVRVVFNKFNGEINVEAPQDAIDVKDLEELLYSSAMGGSYGIIGAINPAEQLAQARDTQRITDLSTMKTAIGLYAATVSEPFCKDSKIHVSTDGTGAVDGTGWLPINMDKIASGSPISTFPIDPTNNLDHSYAYQCDPKTQTYELAVPFEGPDFSDKMKSDGGDDPGVYEVGTNLKIINSSGSSVQETFSSSDDGGVVDLLKQSRDSSRVSDLNTLQSAIDFYLVEVNSPLCVKKITTSSLNGTRATDGTGWLPINFNNISSGSPLARLPIDPINTSAGYYTYSCDPANGGRYEIDGHFESDKYRNSLDLDGKDGGSNSNLYEVGTNLNLIK